MINDLVYKVKNISFDLYLFFGLIIFLIIKIFILNYHYVEHDEVVNLTTYYYKESIFLKNFPNNHFYISLLGVLAEFMVGTNIVFLKFLNFLTFPTILLILYNSFKKKFFVYILFLIFLLSEVLFDYSYLLRGYYISSLLFCYVFYLIFKNFSKPIDSDLKIIFVICALQIINNISSLYLVIPIILAIFFNFKSYSFDKKFIFFLIYFLSIFIFLNTIQILITGLYLHGIYDMKPIVSEYIIQNFTNIYASGFEAIYFDYTLNRMSLFGNFSYLITDVKNNVILYFIFFTSFLILFKNILRKKLIIFDYITFYFFLFFVLLNKLPPERVYVGFVYFFIFYIFYFFKNFEFKIKQFNYLILILSFTLISFKDNFLYRSEALNLKKDIEIKLIKEFKCHLKNQNLSEIETHVYYYLYLKNCDKKRNLNEFVKFYRNNKNN